MVGKETQRASLRLKIYAPLAQLEEQLTLNQWVGGSRPSGRTNILICSCARVAELADAQDLGSCA